LMNVNQILVYMELAMMKLIPTHVSVKKDTKEKTVRPILMNANPILAKMVELARIK